MTRAIIASIVIVGAGLVRVDSASAQTQRLPGTIEFSGGASWLGKVSFGSADATETTPTGSTTKLFETSSSLRPAAGLEARLGVRLAGRAEVEGFMSFAKPTLATTISNDIEAGTTVTARERVTEYVFGGAVLWYDNESPPLRVFVTAGAGYLRQLHESNTLAVTGQIYYGGVGVKYFFLSQRGRQVVKGLGLRVDGRLIAQRRGISLDDRVHYAPEVAGSLFVRF